MDIRSAILEENSRKMADAVADYVGADPDRLKVLMGFFFDGETLIHQRAAYPVSVLADREPDLFLPYLEKMVLNLDNPVHDAVRRCTIRLLQDIQIPEKLMGEIAERCFAFLENPEQPIAIRAFSMVVLYKISLKWPDLQNELRLVIETHLPYGSSGFKNCGNKILKKLR